jgi:hypothetical protein
MKMKNKKVQLIQGKSIDQLKRFIKRVSHGDYSINIQIHTDTDEFAYGCEVSSYIDCGIKAMLLNINTEIEADIRLRLLHEVGHYESDHFKHTQNGWIVEDEYEAHKWAIERTEQLGWTKMNKQLKMELRKWSENRFWWNSCYRRYVLAGRLAVKRKLV